MESMTDPRARYAFILTEYLEFMAAYYDRPAQDALEHQVLADEARGHFQLLRLGWHERRFHFLVLMHFDLKPDGRIWLQQNNTEILVDEELAQRGVDKQDILLGFRPAYLRG
jgi:hypothetical protein